MKVDILSGTTLISKTASTSLVLLFNFRAALQEKHGKAIKSPRSLIAHTPNS